MFVSGHGEPCGKEEVAAHRQRLLESIAVVRDLKERGLSRAEVEQAIIRLPVWAEWEAAAAVPHAPVPQGPRAPISRTRGVANIYDYLDDHPAGLVTPRSDQALPH